MRYINKQKITYRIIQCPECGAIMKKALYDGEGDFVCHCGWHVSFIRVDENNVIPV